MSCVGLDYHYDLSSRDVQQCPGRIPCRPCHCRRGLDLDVEPLASQIHAHRFTDSPEFTPRLLEHFPNRYIGITGGRGGFSVLACVLILSRHAGVVTYATNVLNTYGYVWSCGERPSARMVLDT